MTELRVIAIDPSRLQTVRAAGKDEHGNEFRPYGALGWEPLRCCLRVAAEGESIALISYAAFTAQSPWAEVGPVYVHADDCGGYADPSELPAELRTGPRILRTYHADQTLNYDDIEFVPGGEDVEPMLRELLDRPNVGLVHVRAAQTQCFLYEVRPAR
ncbi:MAG TPA: DUF1203 domain-containing protein [Jatrophihabitantaceae bacterium]|jgi:hypothetical protein